MTNRCARMRVRGYIRILILSILSFLLTPADAGDMQTQLSWQSTAPGGMRRFKSCRLHHGRERFGVIRLCPCS